jgi:hypothetical protein
VTVGLSTAISFPDPGETVAPLFHPGVKASGGDPFMSITDWPRCISDVAPDEEIFYVKKRGVET